MPKGSGLYSQLMAKRKDFEEAIASIDETIRIVRTGKLGHGGRVRKPMSEEQKHKISLAAKKRHAQNKAKARVVHSHSHKPKAINRPSPKEHGQAAAAEA